MINIILPEQNYIEREYGYRILFEACLKLDITFECDADIDYAIICSENEQIRIYCHHISIDHLVTRTLEVKKCSINEIESFLQSSELLPILFMNSAKHNNLVTGSSSDVSFLNFDIGLAAFYIASGAWELAVGVADTIGRIKGKSSWLELNGMLYKPILEIYAKLIEKILLNNRYESSLFIHKKLNMIVTCDVDRPYDSALYHPIGVIRRILRNIAYERSITAVLNTINKVSMIYINGWIADPNNTFEYMMDVNEKNDHQIAFYFICNRDNKIDADYDLSSRDITETIKLILNRGHRIGVHGSYYSQYEPGKLRNEVNKFLKAVDLIGYRPENIEGRQHYLRWHPKNSVGIVVDAGFNIDSTLGFHDCVGFRRGLCKPFPLFDLKQWKTTSVIEYPLIAMDCAVIESDHVCISDTKHYMDAFSRAAHWCKKVDGFFVLLWHNSFLKTLKHREIYEALLAME